jgi:hypothetical protein
VCVCVCVRACKNSNSVFLIKPAIKLLISDTEEIFVRRKGRAGMQPANIHEGRLTAKVRKSRRAMASLPGGLTAKVRKSERAKASHEGRLAASFAHLKSLKMTKVLDEQAVVARARALEKQGKGKSTVQAAAASPRRRQEHVQDKVQERTETVAGSQLLKQ